jgi:hypothetical protein
MSECVQMSKASPLFIVFKSFYWGRLLFFEILFPLYYWADFSSSKFYFHFIIGPTSLPGNSISTLLFSYGRTSLPGNSISTLLFFCGPTSLPRCSSTVQWSSFDFYSSSLGNTFRCYIKHQHSLLVRKVFFHDVLL